MSSRLIETLAFSEAKAKLSDLMTSVVHGHRPKAVDRHHGKEQHLPWVARVAFTPAEERRGLFVRTQAIRQVLQPA